jgi:hypothetical protein
LVSLKGKGFSPYVKCPKMIPGFSPRGNNSSN